MHMNWLRKLFGSDSEKPASGLRPVPGALVASDKATGQVVYNMLTPHMQQFMGRCVSAIKRGGIAAKGTGQFSILVSSSGQSCGSTSFISPATTHRLLSRLMQRHGGLQMWPNTLRRMTAGRRGCHRRASWPLSLSVGR